MMINYDELAEKLVGAYLNNPGENLTELINGLLPMMSCEKKKIRSYKDHPILMDKFKLKLLEMKEKARAEPERIVVEPEIDDVLESLKAPQLLFYAMQKMYAEWEEFKKQFVAKQQLPIPPAPIHVQSPLIPKLERTKIGICGCFHKQFMEIQAAIGHKARLKYVDRDHKPFQYPQLDHLILVKSFISHNHTEVAFKTFERSKVRIVDGAISNVIREVELICGK